MISNVVPKIWARTNSAMVTVDNYLQLKDGVRRLTIETAGRRKRVGNGIVWIYS